jgi:hypothetical protein
MTDPRPAVEQLVAVDPVGPRVRVARLSSLALIDIAREEPDVRGWPLVTNDGQRVGRVRDLLVELETREVRYLDVAFDLAYADGRPDLRVAIPIGCARAGTRRNVVNVRCVSRDQVRHAPLHGSQRLTVDEELASRRFFGASRRDVVVEGRSDAFFAGADYDASQFWSVRRTGREALPYLAPLTDAEAAERKQVIATSFTQPELEA